ncbi:gluconokinase [Spirochaeta dissipatitropha]
MDFILPDCIAVMGVAGCGKSTVAARLAGEFKGRFLDADDFHSAEAKARMASGKPLDDEMRFPWVHRLTEEIRAASAGERHGLPLFLAFSGLRQAHRNLLRETAVPLLFLYLKGSREILLERMESRIGHFMSPDLIDSQLAAMEDSSCESDVLPVDVGQPLDDVLESCRQALMLRCSRDTFSKQHC